MVLYLVKNLHKDTILKTSTIPLFLTVYWYSTDKRCVS